MTGPERRFAKQSALDALYAGARGDLEEMSWALRRAISTPHLASDPVMAMMSTWVGHACAELSVADLAGAWAMQTGDHHTMTAYAIVVGLVAGDTEGVALLWGHVGHDPAVAVAVLKICIQVMEL